MKINIISGFLGAGKTTFLNKIIPHMQGKNAVIENELGSAAIDGDLIKGGLPVTEISAGCVCCGLAGTLIDTIAEVRERFNPDAIFIEPSGVGMLTDVINVCKQAHFKAGDDAETGFCVTIVDASCWFDFKDSFGAFYTDQVRSADAIFFSHLDELSGAERDGLFADIAEMNHSALIYARDWFDSGGEELLAIIESTKACSEDGCGHHEHEHHHHEHGHEHHHDHEHEHHHGLLTSLSVKDVPPVSESELDAIISAIRGGECGGIVRAKGILKLTSGGFVRFDVTGKHASHEAFPCGADTDPKAVIIGRDPDGERFAELFGCGAAI